MCHCTSATKLTAYETLKHLLLEYANTLWDPFTEVITGCLKSVQKKALGFVYNLCRGDTSVSSLYEAPELLSLARCRQVKRLHAFCSVVHGENGPKFGDYLALVRVVPQGRNTLISKLSFIAESSCSIILFSSHNSLMEHVTTTSDEHSWLCSFFRSSCGQT